MSEFYFDYKCIAMGDVDPNPIAGDRPREADKALDFYLYQNYNVANGSMCVQVFVSKEMQRKFCAARLYFVPHGTEFPDLSEYSISQLIPREPTRMLPEAPYFIHTDNSIFIESQGGELSGCGVIAFIDGENPNASPKVENAYKFVINYSKKEIISYRIVEHKSRISIEIIYPLIRTDIVLHVIRKVGAKPVLIRDRDGADKYLCVDKKIVSVTLPANGRIEDVIKKSFPVESAVGTDFRLVFDDIANNQHYLLVDESDYTIEDKSERKREKRGGHKLKDAVHRCPYCGRPMGKFPKYVRGRSEIYGCDGTLIMSGPDSKFDPKLQHRRTIVCSADLRTLSDPKSMLKGSESDKFDIPEGTKSYIPVDKLIIPDGYTELPAMNVLVAGMTESGKTIYLSSLMNMINGGDTLGLFSKPFILNRILNVFDRKGKDSKSVEEVKYDNVETEDGRAILGHECERLRSGPDKIYKSRYVLSVGNHVESNTQPRFALPLSWHPIGYRMGRLGFLYFYDVPGEVLTMRYSFKARSVDMADCFIAVINGDPLHITAGSKVTPVDEMKEALEQLEKMRSGGIGKDTPIAVVLTKHDLKLSDYIDKSDRERLLSCFDENCHIVREDMLDLMPKNGVYAGSALERHIDCSSYELEHYLRAAHGAGEILDALKQKFSNIKFFTCSALGSNDRLGEPVRSTKEVLFGPRRLRMELPIIWLMYQRGLIRR